MWESHTLTCLFLRQYLKRQVESWYAYTEVALYDRVVPEWHTAETSQKQIKIGKKLLGSEGKKVRQKEHFLTVVFE